MTDDDTSSPDDPNESQPAPAPAGPGRWRPGRSRSRQLVVAGTLVVTAVVAGSAVALAIGGTDGGDDDVHHTDQASQTSDDAHGAGHDENHRGATATPDEASAGDDAPGAMGSPGRMGQVHPHEPLPPYEQRHTAASPDEQAAADELRAAVRTAIAGFADADAAVAAGYQPGDSTGQLAHYLDRSVAEEGHVLDPARPNGLVYDIGGEGDPVLVGAFFVALPGVEAPMPAGDLVAWHSHSPSCPGFFATEAAPCTGARRMLHVWTTEEIEVARRSGRTVDMQVVDPFGAPFGAAVDPAA